MNLKVGDKVHLKSKEWIEENKILISALHGNNYCDDSLYRFSGCNGTIIGIYRNTFTIKLEYPNNDTTIWCYDDMVEPISYGYINTCNSELKKSVTVNVPNDMEVSTDESNERITINILHKADKKKETKFKNGDIIYVQERAGGYIAIFQNMWDDVIDMHAVLHLRTGLVYTKEILIRKNIISIRKASRGEQSKLFQVLAKQKKLHWNAEELKFEKYRWRAEHGDRYWYITELGTIIYSPDNYSPYDNILYKLRNYFQTEEIAKQALPKYKDFFKNLNIK